MHRIVQSHLESFANEHGLHNDDQATQFEKFCNYCFLQPKVAGKLDTDDVSTSEADDGVDGVALIVNEEMVQSSADAQAVFARERRNNDVEVAFIQAKRSEGFDLGDILKFKESILRFLTETPYGANDELQRDVRSAFDIALDNVPKIRDGKPALTAVFATTGTYSAPTELETARAQFVQQLESLGYFSRIDVRFVGRDDVIKAWVDSYSGVQATLLMHSYAGLPQIAGIAESYLAVVRAKDFVEQILQGPDGTIRNQIFEDNVRHYLGADNPVNQSIAATLADGEASSRFPVLNNGVTLVCPDVVVQTNRLFVKNFQIVNGCQTSHVLFENRSRLSDELMMTLKVVETDDEDVFGELVRATNSQSEIRESQFLSLSPMARRVEAYFNTFEGKDGRLYFERRDRQYVGRGVPALRVVDLDAAARAVCAMYLRRPDLAFKYPKAMYDTLGEQLFEEANREAIYYSSALVLYRIHVLTSAGTAAGSARKYKWHVLPLVSALLAGKDVPPLNSRKVEKYADKIVDVFQVQSDQISDVLAEAVDVILRTNNTTTERLKRKEALDEMLSLVP